MKYEVRESVDEMWTGWRDWLGVNGYLTRAADILFSGPWQKKMTVHQFDPATGSRKIQFRVKK